MKTAIRYSLLGFALAFLILPYAGPVAGDSQSTLNTELRILHKNVIDIHSKLLAKMEIQRAIAETLTKQSDIIAREIENPDYSGGSVASWSIGGATVNCSPLTANSPKRVGQDIKGDSEGSCNISNANNARIEWHIITGLSWQGRSGTWYPKSTNSEYPTGQRVSWRGGGHSTTDNCKVGNWVTSVIVSVKDSNNPDENFGSSKQSIKGFWEVADAISASVWISSCNHIEPVFDR